MLQGTYAILHFNTDNVTCMEFCCTFYVIEAYYRVRNLYKILHKHNDSMDKVNEKK